MGIYEKVTKKLFIYNFIFFGLATIYSQTEYNITSLIKADGLYQEIGNKKLPHLVSVYKLDNYKKTTLGNLINGKKHGTWKEVYPDKRILVENYKNGNLEGPVSLFYKNRQKEWRYNYTKGILNGTYSRWYANGQKAVNGYFENGEPVGVWAWWDQTGKFLRKEKYSPKKNGITNHHNQYTKKIDIYN